MRKCSLSLVLFSGSLVSAQTEQKVLSGDLSHEARLIPYNKRAIFDVYSQIRTEAAIVLPDAEKVMAVTCGDAGEMGNWITVWSPDSNVVVVKPAKQGATTSLNIQTNHGLIYTGVLHEVSLIPGAHADLKVYIQPDEEMRTPLNQPPKFVAASVADAYKHEAEMAHAEAAVAHAKADAAQKQAAAELDRTKAETEAKYPEKMKLGYIFDHSKKAPFPVDAIWNDGKFTYIAGHFSEPPAVFETKDGQPALIDCQYEDGVYVLRKVVDQGTLRVGKKQMAFERKAG